MIKNKSRKKVLIVDDEPSIRKLIKAYLYYSGAEFYEARDGATGYLKFKNIKFDLLIIDVTMPKVSGPELIRTIRTVDKDIKILMLTSCAEKEVIEKVKDYGIQGWIIKPFTEETLKSKFDKLIS